MLEQITNALIDLTNRTGFVGIFIATVLESFFAPIPSEIILVTAGLASRENGGLPTLIIFCMAGAFGNYIGTLPFYAISRWGAETFLPKFLNKWGPFLLISNNDLQKAQKLFATRGKSMVFFARLIPGIRSIIAFPAGVSKMHFPTYTFFTLLGSFIWNLVLGTIGFYLYDAKDQVFALLSPIEKIVIAILVILVGGYILRVMYQIRKLTMAAQIDDLPKAE
jgi:membrane protein DedA with SNARE-associated domain